MGSRTVSNAWQYQFRTAVRNRLFSVPFQTCSLWHLLLM
jgi:hypothetical protein